LFTVYTDIGYAKLCELRVSAMGKLIVIALVVAAGYWYWTGPYQQGGQSGGEKRLQENARNMERCVRREASMNASSGMAGGGVSMGDSEKLCAGELGLYQQDGQWHDVDRGE
jgi:hypothetical protein